jgi:tripartite-type tricarboxylate transporter receptor subunit TctC
MLERSSRQLAHWLLAACFASALPVHAFPDRPVTIVVPATPGGLTDTLARLIAPEFSQAWGQPVVVENRPGAGSLLGTQYAMRSKADGHTLLMGSTDLQTLPLLNRNIAIDTVAGLQPVGSLATMPLLMLGSSRVAERSLPKVVEAMKKSPDKFTYASNGIASILQLYAEMFSHEAGVKLLHVPFRGAVEATQALASGEVDFLVQPATANVLGQVTAGRVVPYAVMSRQRIAQLPDTPTVAELGYPQLEIELWFGLFSPAGVPAPVVEQINASLRLAMRKPEFQTRLKALGLTARDASVAAFTSFYLDDHRHLEKVVRDASIVPN